MLLTFLRSYILTSFLVSAGQVSAETSAFPHLYWVISTEPDNVLPVFSNPSEQAPVIGTIQDEGPSNGTMIKVEVLEITADGQWGLIGLNDTNGWVSMDALQRQQLLMDHRAPRPMICLGSHPSWQVSLQPDDFTVNWNLGSEGEELLAQIHRDDAGGQRSQDIASYQSDETGDLEGRVLEAEGIEAGYRIRILDSLFYDRHFIVRRNTCSIEASGRQFGWSVVQYFERGDGSGDVLAGCCTMDPNF